MPQVVQSLIKSTDDHNELGRRSAHMIEIDIYDLFEQLYLLPYRADDVFDMQQGDIYLVGTITGELTDTSVKNGLVVAYFAQAFFKRVHGALEFTAYSSMPKYGNKTGCIKAQGKIKISMKKKAFWLDPVFQSALEEFKYVAEQLNVLSAICDEQQLAKFKQAGLNPLFAGLWLDKHLQQVEAVPIVSEDGKASVNIIDFSDSPIRFDDQQIDEFISVSFDSIKSYIRGRVN